VFQDRQQAYGVQRIGADPGDQRRQFAHRKPGQRRAGGGVGQHAPPRQPRRHPPRQHRIGRDQGGGAAFGLQGFAQQEGGHARGLVLGPRGDHRKAVQTFGERIDAGLASFLAQRLDLVEPIGGGLGRPQRFVDDPPPPAAARIARSGRGPG
jgi:hypothetical protein